MSFGKDIRKFKEKATKAGEMIFRGSALEIFSAIIRRTPVDSGRARGNWQASVNTAQGGTVDSFDKTGSKAVKSAKSATIKATLGDTLYLTNNLEYIVELEDGSSLQAPVGMVKATITEWKRTVARQAGKV